MLAPGTRLGVYEVLGLVGAGGMGEVYRARDTRLDRDVALKILPESFTTDPDRVMRFEREAKALAALNHPHIAQIYSVEQGATSAAFLVMELVEGDTLHDRIVRAGAIPLDEALPIARQIAEALEAAHDAGIIHRDLKPANIKVRPDGTVKVLDFGLAKTAAAAAAADAGLQSPTMTSPAVTGAGVILGTAAYMSPEQAKGKTVDERADIWAFGCVLYEMLTATPPFSGESVSDVVAAVLKEEPRLAALPRRTPAALHRLLRRCLAKNPTHRLRDFGDARLDIDEALDDLSRPALPADTPAPRRLMPMLLLAAVAFGLGSLVTWWWQRPPTAPGHWIATQLGGPRLSFQPRLSPDGRTLAFLTLVGRQSQLAVMNTDTGDWSLLTRQAAMGPVVTLAWSADGSRIYFDRSRPSGREIYSVSPLGGEPRLVLENASVPEPLPDDSMLFLRPNANGDYQLHRYWPDSARVSSFPVAVHTAFVASLRAFRDGREAIAYGRLIRNEGLGPYELHVVNVETGAIRQLPYGAGSSPAMSGSEAVVPLGISADDRDVLTTVREGTSSTVIKIARDQPSAPRFLFTTTRLITSLNESSEGHIYIDQADRTMEHLRVGPEGGAPQRLAVGLPSLNAAGALHLGGGRTVYATLIAGRHRLVVGHPGQELVPFVDTRDAARAPLARVNDREFLFIGGELDAPIVTLASSDSGRILRRLDETRGRTISRMAVSPDGRTVYFASLGDIWTMPLSGGEPQRFARGTGIALDHRTGDVFIERRDNETVQIVRRSSTGDERPLIWPSSPRPSGLSLWPQASSPDRRLLVVAESDDSWFWGPAIYDLNTSRVTQVPIDFAGDAEVDLAWDGDSITVLARRLESSLWRFDARQ